MKLEVGMYCYDKTNRQLGIAKIIGFKKNNNVTIKYSSNEKLVSSDDLVASSNIIDLIEYMDLLVIKKVKLYDKNMEIYIFNPVRCDGFTKFSDGTSCIILNLDYLVDVKDLKIKKVLTWEQFENNCYEIGD